MRKPRMGKRPRYGKGEVLRSIEDCGGIVSTVAERLGASWSTARALIQRWPETQAAFEAEREGLLDAAESLIHRAIHEGDVQSAKWLLSRLGRHRGYGDHVEVSGRQAMEIVLRWPDEEAGLKALEVEVGDGE